MRSLANRLVLIAVNDAADAHYLVLSLELAGADVVVAANQLEALQRSQQFTFDAAVLDNGVGSQSVAALLGPHGIPYCVCPCSGIVAWTTPILTQVDQVSDVLTALTREASSPES
jgi:CheY-like chemotaxis protein